MATLRDMLVGSLAVTPSTADPSPAVAHVAGWDEDCTWPDCGCEDGRDLHCNEEPPEGYIETEERDYEPHPIAEAFAERRGVKILPAAVEYSSDPPAISISRPEDAYLIAAAPDLYAALERTLSWLTSYQGGGAIGVWEQASAALSKARGEQP